MEAEAIPDRTEGAELLASLEPPAAGHALGPGCGQCDGDVVADLGVPGGEDLAVDGPTEDALAERVAKGIEGRAQADPIVVHGRGQRSRRRVAGEAALFCGERREVEAEAADPFGCGRSQPSEAAKVGEVVVREATGFVEAGGTVPERFEHRFIEPG